MRYLVTGGLGFIGSAVVRSLCQDPNNEVFIIDKMGYAADIENVGDITHAKLSMTDLANEAQVKSLVVECNPDFIIHLAAESHVDNSIKNPRAFIDSNIIGTYNLLEAARLLPKNKLKMFIHVSTDEVYTVIWQTLAFPLPKRQLMPLQARTVRLRQHLTIL
ncbi:dTDP-glucose 4,6-dehydratase [Escherichia phage KKP 3954]|nr:dTDP-glucose 4,6-dehydratase [Escherichia phage KKP 3954]